MVADHFAHEEAQLELNDYSLLTEHQKTHQMIDSRIEGFAQKAKHSQSLFELRHEMQCLDNWFVTHFNTTDQMYGGMVEDVPDPAML